MWEWVDYQFMWMFCVTWNETENYSWTKGIDREYSDSKSTNTKQTKQKPRSKTQNIFRPPCSSLNRQPISVQNWTREATAWKGKCIHLKQACTGKNSEGGSHPQPSLCEVEKCQSLPLRHTQMTFHCVFPPKYVRKVLYLGKERARSCLTKVRVPACTGLEPSSGSV